MTLSNDSSRSHNNNANNTNQALVSQIRPINNSNTIDRIARLPPMPQITENSFENVLFNGTNFKDENSLESSILPAGFSGSSLFP